MTASTYKDDIETYLASCFDVKRGPENDGTGKFWCVLNESSGLSTSGDVRMGAGSIRKFETRESCQRFAYGWIKNNMPHLYEDAKTWVREGEVYRRLKTQKLTT